MDSRQQFIDLFGDALAKDDRLVQECINICQMFNVSPNDLFYKWEAYNYSNARRLSTQFNLDSALALKAQMQRSIATQTTGKLTGPQKPLLSLNRRFGASPAAVIKVESESQHSSGELRVAVGRNHQKEGLDVKSVPATKVRFERFESDSQLKRFRYMYERILERSEVLDDRIDEMAEILRAHYNIPDFGDPAALSEDAVTIVGSITVHTDGSSNSTRLTDTNVALQSSRSTGSGVVVPLSFDPSLKVHGGSAPSSLFPGAIVALRGKNGGGGWFQVTEVLFPPAMEPRPRPRTPGSSGPFSMCIASGPFTPDGDLKYQYWHQLLKRVRASPLDVILLLGPFVDATHPRLCDGDIDQSPAQLFKEQFLDEIHAYLDDFPSCTVILVPSVRDIMSEHTSLPQSELRVPFSVDSRVHLCSNPCQFLINDVAFAVTTTDVLFHLRKEELPLSGNQIDPAAKSSETGDGALANACRHLLQQRSFYPLFPVPESLSHDVNLDISHSGLLKLGKTSGSAVSAPDVLVLPSRLKQFSKSLNESVVVNPSSVNKGSFGAITFTGKDAANNVRQQQVELCKLSAQ